METRYKGFGLASIFLGIIFLLENLGAYRFNFSTIWPVVVILVGVSFLTAYFLNRRNTSFIIPGTILVIYGLLFLYCTLFSWEAMQQLWPIFLLGPGLGFLFLYLTDRDGKSTLWASLILIILTFLFAFRYVQYLKYWPVLLVLLGIVLVFKKGK